jgi:succinate dehydrogenase / fumarate reductase membrane anchor subunit
VSETASRTTAEIAPAWERAAAAPAQEVSSRLFDYVLLRVTGLVLSVLVLGHFAVTHFVTDVAGNDASFVARRLSSLGWVAWDAAMLAAALAHGAAGVRIALADYGSRRRSLLAGRLVVALAVVVFAVGVVAIEQAAHV